MHVLRVFEEDCRLLVVSTYLQLYQVHVSGILHMKRQVEISQDQPSKKRGRQQKQQDTWSASSTDLSAKQEHTARIMEKAGLGSAIQERGAHIERPGLGFHSVTDEARERAQHRTVQPAQSYACNETFLITAELCNFQSAFLCLSVLFVFHLASAAQQLQSCH